MSEKYLKLDIFKISKIYRYNELLFVESKKICNMSPYKFLIYDI